MLRQLGPASHEGNPPSLRPEKGGSPVWLSSQRAVSVFLEQDFSPMPECGSHFKQAVLGSHHGFQANTECGLFDPLGH